MPTFWTIQHLNKWKEFQTKGELMADEDYIPPLYSLAYLWMAKNMKHIPKPNPELEYPVWAWYRFNSKNDKPDLRRGGYLSKGQEGVLIEFEADFGNVLLSDFMNWHFVLNASNRNEFKDEATTISENEVYNWRDIIINPLNLKELNKSGIQATLWSIKMEQVRGVKYFKAK